MRKLLPLLLILVACGSPTPTTVNTTSIDGSGNGTPTVVTENAVVVGGLASAPAALVVSTLTVNNTSNFYQFTGTADNSGYITEFIPTTAGSANSIQYGPDVPLTSVSTGETVTAQCQFVDPACASNCLINSDFHDSGGNQMTPPDNYIVSLTLLNSSFVYSQSLNSSISTTPVTIGSFYSSAGCQTQTQTPALTLNSYFTLSQGSDTSPNIGTLNSLGTFLPVIDPSWKIQQVQISIQ